MGILKATMDDAIEEGSYLATWVCPNCNSENDDDLEIPAFDGSSEKARDWSASDLLEINCDECKGTFEGIISNNVFGVEIALKDHGGNTIVVNIPEDWYLHQQYDPDYSHWLDFETPDDPYSEYMDSYHHIGDIIAEYEGHHSSQIVTRMVFVHHITALEAFLSDTLINHVLDDNDALKRLLKTDDKIRKKKFSLDQIINEQDLVANEVKTYLRGVLYHNLSRVQFLYKTAIRFDIFDVNIDRAKLQRAIELRHHCVHRNGKDKSGNHLAELTIEYVKTIAEIIKQFIERINIKMVEITSDGKF